MQYCDLHTHSSFSDGTDHPGILIRNAVREGLTAIALTDHNTVAGLDAFLTAAEGSGITPVCGCEFTTDMESCELHILGLFLPREVWSEVSETLEEHIRASENNLMQCVTRLQADGYGISPKTLTRRFPGIHHNRAHVARLLVDTNMVPDMRTAFNTVLRPGAGYFNEIEKPNSAETVARIVKWGGVAVWAHPILTSTHEQIERFVPILKAAGLDAIETRYSIYTTAGAEYMRSIARNMKLLESGGSDYHGINKPEITLGCAEVPDVYRRILEATAIKRQK